MEAWIQIITYAILVIVFSFELWISLLNYRHRNSPIPDVVADVYDQKTYFSFQKYTMATFKFGVYVKAIDIVIILVLLVSGFFVKLGSWTKEIFTFEYGSIMMFLFFFYMIGFVIDTVLSAIKIFKIEETYGFNRTTKKTYIMDRLKSFILTILLGGGLIFGLLNLYEYAGKMFVVFAWMSLVVIIVVTNLMYTRFIVPIFNRLTPLEEGSLKDRIEAFAKSVGYEVGQISVMDASKRSTKMNAYFSGFGKTKRIVLYDTLVKKMDDDEIVAVLAHEIGHNKYRHIIYNLIQTALIISIYIFLFIAFLENESFSLAFGFETMNLGFNLVLYTILLNPIVIILSILGSWFSRKFEFQADRFASNHGMGEALIRALKVLAKENYSNLTPHPLYVKIHYSHPPIADRIDAIKKMTV